MGWDGHFASVQNLGKSFSETQLSCKNLTDHIFKTLSHVSNRNVLSGPQLPESGCSWVPLGVLGGKKELRKLRLGL